MVCIKVKNILNTELFEAMYDIAINTLEFNNANSFYDKRVYDKLIETFGQKNTDWFLFNWYRID